MKQERTVFPLAEPRHEYSKEYAKYVKPYRGTNLKSCFVYYKLRELGRDQLKFKVLRQSVEEHMQRKLTAEECRRLNYRLRAHRFRLK